MTESAALAQSFPALSHHQLPESALASFTQALPAVLITLRQLIDQHAAHHAECHTAVQTFLLQARAAINPDLTAADVREMLIQHILTEDIFAQVFNDSDCHRQNNVAQALYALEAVFFTGALKQQTLQELAPYYAAIKAAAAQLVNHSEKQTFLKVIYENFYRVYNPKAAERLGVVYTPNEIVRFMIAGADWLCARHFGRYLIDQEVDILDPATGTGTFICELLEYFRGQPAKLAHKYQYELHANEVGILPYYVANLNIEATYAGITGQYADFPSLCFVDTLENVGAHTQANKETGDLFGAVSTENKARIQRQNRRRISVVIGNPPYNANQANENDNNKNRAYPGGIDARIAKTYIAASTAQKTKLYDPFVRFFRWASDRLNEDGIIAFIINRSFIDGRTFDGFRQIVKDEFDEAWIIDLGGDWKKAGDARASGGNVFGIGTGVAIAFWIKKRTQQKPKPPAHIYYVAANQFAQSAADKLTWLHSHHLRDMPVEKLHPDERNYWLDLTENNFNTLLPLANKTTKLAKTAAAEQAIFKVYSLGVVTARDEWVYDFNPTYLINKMQYFIAAYNATRHQQGVDFSTDIKWTRALKAAGGRDISITFDHVNIRRCLCRPFIKKHLYFDQYLNEFQYQTPQLWPTTDYRTPAICFTTGGRLAFSCFATDTVPNLTVLSLDANQILALYYYHRGERFDNITDWALAQFTAHYAKLHNIVTTRAIDKTAIFHYCYAVLHDPIYRDQYALNLKRDFPRIPFYPDFWRWADWGAALLVLHLNYETAAPFPFTRIDQPDERARAAGIPPKVILRADVNSGTVQLDSETQLRAIPAAAWTYQLGHRSAIEWILDQYTEKTPKDPTIRAQFNTYRFADYKEQVIDLIARVTTVSIETMQIMTAMQTFNRTHPNTP